MRQGQEFRVAVGEVAQAAALLEMTTAVITWGLAGIEQRVARIVVPNNMDRMLGLIKDLLPLRVADPQLRDTVMTWVRDARAAYSRRGAVLHSIWVGPGDRSPHYRFDLKPLSEDLPAATTVDEIREVAHELERLGRGDAVKFISDLVRTTPGPWSTPSTARPNE